MGNHQRQGEKPAEDSHGLRPQSLPKTVRNPETPSFLDSGLVNCRRIHFCCFKPPGGGYLPWQPQGPEIPPACVVFNEMFAI